MKISEAIQVLHSAYKMFGDVQVTFTNETGRPALKMNNVDSSAAKVIPIDDEGPIEDSDLFIDPGTNRFSRS